MNVIIATPTIYQENSPFNHLFADIIGGFVQGGHKVHRLVAVENTYDTAFRYGFNEETVACRLYKRKRSDHGNIISRYIRDNLTSLRQAFGILRQKNADVLFEDVCYSSVWPALAAKCKGIAVVAMLQDVWPDNAVQSGLIREGSFLYRFFEFWQKIVYKKADRIVCISDDMKAFIQSKGVAEEKITVIYNWGYSDDTNHIAWEDNLFVQKYNLSPDKFYAVYAGNIGRMQNVELIVEAANELRNHSDIAFLVIGEGVNRDAVESLATQYALENLTMLPFQPSELAPHIYSMAGVNLITLVKDGVKSALPSKTGVVLSCGQPIICTYGTQAQFGKLVAESGAGISVDADNSKQLAEAILHIRERTYDKQAAYGMFKRFFVRSNNIKQYAQVISTSEKQ